MKKIVLFCVIMYSCLIYPIELQQTQLQLIEKEKPDLEVKHLGLERVFNFYADLDFFKINISYNPLEF